MQHLGDPVLGALARGALARARGPLVAPDTALHLTLWDGKFDVEGGKPVDCTVEQFARWLAQRGCEVRSKGDGIVACPVTSCDGRRTNESVTAMHGVNLDCDGCGAWDVLLGVLGQLGLAHIAYQSGGYTPEVPKWHLVLPLAAPFDVQDEAARARWKRTYHALRVVCGALGGLLGEAFDPACETPCQPVFVTERRAEADPPRQVLVRYGSALDARALAGALPRTEETEGRRSPPRALPAASPPRALGDRRDLVVSALVRPMAGILCDRRDLYLALAGALLDRGVCPDDARAIIEDVSLRCPGDPRYTSAEVEARHREHLHGVETTIARWRKGATYTRVGTLVERWPEVASALDEALPHPMTLRVREMLAEAERRSDKETTAPASPSTPFSLARARAAAERNAQEIRQLLESACKRRLRAEHEEEVARGFLLRRFLRGEPLTEPSDPEPLQISPASALARVAGQCAFALPAETPVSALVQIGLRSIATTRDFEGDPAAFFRTCYERSLADRLTRDAEAVESWRRVSREEDQRLYRERQQMQQMQRKVRTGAGA